MIDFKVKKQTNNVTRDQIIDYLDNKFWEEKQYKCMPENEIGYEFVPREALEKIVDGLIPMIKNMIKQKNNNKMLESNREGFAVMSSDLKSFSYESESYNDCLRYLHKGDVIARRIPRVIGFGIDFYWFSDYCKPIYLKWNRQKNILWLHFNFHFNYTHKTGEIIQLCDHPKEFHESYHDGAIICRKCDCMISQFGKTFDIPLPMGISY